MAKGSFKDFEICFISNSIASTKNNDNESEINSVEDNAACLNHFFLKKNNLNKLTDKKSIGHGV